MIQAWTNYNSGAGRRRVRDYGNARPDESVEEVADPPEQRERDVERGTKNPAAQLQSGNAGGSVSRNRGLCRETSAHSFHEVQLEHTRWQASWLMADSDASPPSHPRQRGQWLEPGLNVNLDWRASRQLQWRDRTGFSPDFLFSSPQSRGRAVERTTCGGSQIQLLTAPP